MKQQGVTVVQEVDGFRVLYTRFRDFDHARCTLDQGKEFVMAPEVASASRGIAVLHGGLLFTEGSAIGQTANTGPWVDNFWSSPPAQTTVKAQGIAIQTEWVCISRNRKDILPITSMVVSEPFVLQQGNGLVVVTGLVTVGEEEIAEDEFFKAETDDVTVSGDAIILVIGV